MNGRKEPLKTIKLMSVKIQSNVSKTVSRIVSIYSYKSNESMSLLNSTIRRFTKI